MKSHTRTLAASLALFGTLASLTACSSSSGNDSADGGKLELRVVSLIPGSDQAAFDAFDEQVSQFEEANPDIDIQAEEYEWTGPTFAAQLAGGTLPDVFTIPFTDVQTLIQNGQLADVTSQFDSLDYASKFNQNVLDVASRDGRVYGIPFAAYGNGLHYNRELFTQAGLDPDTPPTTWEEVREAAAAISKATGQAGYSMMSQGNTGGWQLAVATYARGGRLQEPAGDSFTMTADNQGTKAALEYLRELRWEDNSMGSNFLLDWGTINQAFAAGQIGMFTSGSDIYGNLVQAQNINPDDYGLTTLPLEGSDAGVLTGGAVAAMSIQADEEHKNAAAKWVDFYYLQKQVNEDAAVKDAQTLSASGQPVGIPSLPIFDQETLDQTRAWTAEYINVPESQINFFLDGIYDQDIVPEPQAHTQELYSALDNVVQAVLTDENADIDALLKGVNAEIQPLIAAD